MSVNWQELASASHYRTAVAIAERLQEGDVQDARAGLEELIDAVGRSEKRALRSQLVRLMVHVLKWKYQPDRRSGGWVASIYSARDEIEAIREEVPSLTPDRILEMWDGCLASARKQAQAETGTKLPPAPLSWDEAFEAEYAVAADDESAEE